MSLRLAVLLVALLPLSGCSTLTLQLFWQDKIFGPLSPQGGGNSHNLAFGDGFTVSENGPAIANAPVPLWRPYALSFLSRIAQPQQFYFAMKGFHSFFYGLSPVVMIEHSQGVPLTREQLGGLKRGATAAEVIERLGTPQLWIRRKQGGLMAYRADHSTSLRFWVGTPPFLATGIPGAENLSFRFHTTTRTPYKTVLFFDADDHLVSYSHNLPGDKGDEAVQE